MGYFERGFISFYLLDVYGQLVHLDHWPLIVAETSIISSTPFLQALLSFISSQMNNNYHRHLSEKP